MAQEIINAMPINLPLIELTLPAGFINLTYTKEHLYAETGH
jgi:hypothetical protein